MIALDPHAHAALADAIAAPLRYFPGCDAFAHNTHTQKHPRAVLAALFARGLLYRNNRRQLRATSQGAAEYALTRLPK